MKRLISMALVAGGFLLACGSQAFAWDGRWGHGGRDRWHRHHSRHSSVVLVVEERPVYHPTVVEVVPAPADTVVVNIPNDNGSYTPVTLRRVGGVYIGPRGEQYLNLPTVDQLKPVYGLK